MENFPIAFNRSIFPTGNVMFCLKTSVSSSKSTPIVGMTGVSSDEMFNISFCGQCVCIMNNMNPKKKQESTIATKYDKHYIIMQHEILFGTCTKNFDR